MPFSVSCGACGASFKLSQEIYERRIKGRQVALRCKKCRAEIPVDGTKLEEDTLVVAGAELAGSAPVVDPNLSFVPQLPVTETAINERAPMASAPEILPRDTSWFPSGASDSVAPAVIAAQNAPQADPVPAILPEPAADPVPAILPEPAADPPGRGPMDTPRVPIAVGREAMPTPRNLDASALAAAADGAGFDAPEPPTKPGSAAATERLAMAEAQTPRTSDASAPENPPLQAVASPTAVSAMDGGASGALATPHAAQARAPAPRVVPRPKLDSKSEASQPKRGAPEQVAKQGFKKPESPSRPKQEAPKPELPSRPKQEAPKPELPSRPKQEAPKPELPSRPKQEAPKPELPSRPKQEAPPKPELHSRPKQASHPALERQSQPGPPPRPKLESRPDLAADPPVRPRQESRPRLESSPGPEEEARARAVAVEAVARALASTEPKAAGGPTPAVPAPSASASAVPAVPVAPEPRPISLPPARPSLPPGRRWAFIGGLAAALVVSLVVLGWALSAVSSKPDLPPAPSGTAPVTSAAPPPEPTAEAEEEEEEEAVAPAPTPESTGDSPPAPGGSAPGLLEQAVSNLNSQAGGDGKSFDREAALKALDAAANRASRCRSKGDPSGNVTVLVIFNPSGTVKEAKVVDTRYDGRPTARCIASRMAQARIRPFEGTPKTLAKSVVIP